jgi:hypothetical protein
MKIDAKKIINEAKNRMIMFKGGKLPKENYNEKDYDMDSKLIECFNNYK